MTCPRCGGFLYEDKDYAGHFRSCLTCGHLEPTNTPNYIGPSYDPTGTPPPTRVGKGGHPGIGQRGRTPAQQHPRR